MYTYHARWYLYVISLFMSKLTQVLADCVELSCGAHGRMVATCSYQDHYFIPESFDLRQTEQTSSTQAVVKSGTQKVWQKLDLPHSERTWFERLHCAQGHTYCAQVASLVELHSLDQLLNVVPRESYLCKCFQFRNRQTVPCKCCVWSAVVFKWFDVTMPVNI